MKKKDNEGVRRSRVTPLTCLFVDGCIGLTLSFPEKESLYCVLKGLSLSVLKGLSLRNPVRLKCISYPKFRYLAN